MGSSNKQHRLVSVAFRDNFNTANLPSDWGKHFVTESKDSKTKAVLGGGMVFAYSFGALTFVDADPAERTAEIESLKRHLNLDLQARVTTEEFYIEENPTEKPRVEYHRLVIDQLTPERIAVVAQVIAQSAALEYYEQLMDTVKAKVSEMTDRLADHGGIGVSPGALYKQIGYAMSIRNEVIGMMHLLDKPDLIWEDKVMDGLYNELRAAFDLGDRFKALEYKLTMVHESLEVFATTVKDTRMHRLEWTVIILIAVEVVFTLMARFHVLGW